MAGVSVHVIGVLHGVHGGVLRPSVVLRGLHGCLKTVGVQILMARMLLHGAMFLVRRILVLRRGSMRMGISSC